MAFQTVFNRYEKKYLLNSLQYRSLRDALEGQMIPDQYGESTICNIYYDTEQDDLIRTSIEKPPYKEKLRLRSYGIPSLTDTVFLEIKKKYQGIVNKRRLSLPLCDAYAWLNEGKTPEPRTQIIKEIDYFLKHYPLQPRLYLAYDRTALFGADDSDFRVTFDCNIRSRRSDIRLENGDDGLLLLGKGYYLMESKILGATPLWFSHLLADLKIYPCSFSKYGNIYKKQLVGTF